MKASRRRSLLLLLSSLGISGIGFAQQQTTPDPRHPLPPDHDVSDDDVKLPNGKSQKDAISKREHEEALKDAESLLTLAENLRDELKHNGEFVVAVSSVRKTEEIEKLAKRIRGKLKM